MDIVSESNNICTECGQSFSFHVNGKCPPGLNDQMFCPECGSDRFDYETNTCPDCHFNEQGEFYP